MICPFTTPTTSETYTLSLHDALPILPEPMPSPVDAEPKPEAVASAVEPAVEEPALDLMPEPVAEVPVPATGSGIRDRKSTRLNSSHVEISYAVFCLKKKKMLLRLPHT